MLGNLDCTSKQHRGRGRRGEHRKPVNVISPEWRGNTDTCAHAMCPTKPTSLGTCSRTIPLTTTRTPPTYLHTHTLSLYLSLNTLIQNKKCLPQNSTKSTRRSAPWARSSRLLASKVPATMSSSRYAFSPPSSLSSYFSLCYYLKLLRPESNDTSS